MRVIGGNLKRSVIKGFDIDGTRPTTDRIKESLFAMIQEEIKDKTVLDLFSGSGALGIEAISRGCKKVVFIDKNIQAIKIIKENITKLHIKNFNIIKSDFKTYLETTNELFDIIFLDPPYKSDYINTSLILINKYNLLKDNGIIVCESSEIANINYLHYNIYKTKEYKDKCIVILKKM